MSVTQIVEGHINELLGKHKDLSQARLEVCLKCPICKMSDLGPICDSTKWINANDEFSDKPKVSFTKGCGCRLQAKVTLKRAHCVVNKW